MSIMETRNYYEWLTPQAACNSSRNSLDRVSAGIVLHSFAQIQQAHSKIHDPSGRALKILKILCRLSFLVMNLRTFTIHSSLAQAQSCSFVMRPHCSTLQLCMIDLVKSQTIPSGDSHSVYFKDPQIINPYSTHNLRVLSRTQWTNFFH